MHVDVVSYINSCPRCLCRKSQPDKAPLLNIEASQPLKLVHLDYLKIEPSKGNIENVLVITDQFTRYAQAFPSKTQTALATAKLLWNNVILHYGFQLKIITDQGWNFESELIENLCQLAGVQMLRTSPYHPQTNRQCEHFNATLLNMLGTSTHSRRTGKVMSLLWYMAITALGMQLLGLAPIISFLEGSLGSLWM